MQCSGLRARGDRDDDQGRNRGDFCLADVVVWPEGLHFRHKLIELRRVATPGRETINHEETKSAKLFSDRSSCSSFLRGRFSFFAGRRSLRRDERNRAHGWKNCQIMARRRSPIFARPVRHSPRVRTEDLDLSRPPAGPRLWVRPAK